MEAGCDKAACLHVYFTLPSSICRLLFQAGSSTFDASSGAVILVALDGEDGATNIAARIGRSARPSGSVIRDDIRLLVVRAQYTHCTERQEIRVDVHHLSLSRRDQSGN